MQRVSEYFTVRPGVYARHLLAIFIERWWWMFVIPMAALLLLGMTDVRWLIVALMLLLVVSPGVLLLVYFNYALTPDTARRVLPQRVIVNDSEGFVIEYAQPDDFGHRHPDEHISADRILRIDDAGSMIVLRLKSSPYSIIILPTEVAETMRISALA